MSDKCKFRNGEGELTKTQTTDDVLDVLSVDIEGHAKTLRELLIDVEQEHNLLDHVAEEANRRTAALEELERELASGDSFDEAKIPIVRETQRASIVPYLRIKRGDVEITGQSEDDSTGFFEADPVE
jgi:hypothetical protein